MIVSGFLENPEVRRWLNGVEPAWTMLEFDSLNALRHEPSTSNHAIRLEPDLANAEISGSAIAPVATSRRDRWTEANRHRQSDPRLRRGDVRDHGMAGVRQGRSVRFSKSH